MFGDETKNAIPAARVCFIAGIGIALFILLQGCAASSIPEIDVSFWAGDSSQGSITRFQDHQNIDCRTPEFDHFACMTYLDIKKIYSKILECKQW